MSGLQGSGAASSTTAPAAGEKGQLYQSLVRFTRFYATLSPTMMALLLAKKTRYGRYIPLPDALPDGTKVGRWVFGTPNGANGTDETAPTGSTHGRTVPGHNGEGFTNGAAGEAYPEVVGGHPVDGVLPDDDASQVDPTGSCGSGFAETSPMATRTVRVVEYEVMHDVPGRVRVRIPRLAHDTRFAQRLADGIMALPGVHEARVNPASRSLVVRYRQHLPGSRAQPAMVSQVIESIRDAARVEAVKNLAPEGALAGMRAGQVDVVGRLALPALSLGVSLGMLAGASLPAWLAGGVVLLAARPIFGRAAEGMRTEKRLTVEFLDATTITLMVLQASFLPPAIITSVIEGSEVLREMTARRSRQASLDLMLSLERQTTVERAGSQVKRSWDQIEPDDVLLLYAGDQIPVDGLVLDGRALVDQHRVTGDALPVVRTAGDRVQATTLLIEGHLRVLAQQTGSSTLVGQTLAAVQAVPPTDTRVSNLARKVGNWAVVPTLMVGGAVFASSGSLARTTGIVNLDLGTGMRVSAPIVILNAQTQAARRGILIRSGRAIEMLAAIDTVLFDKTATLTGGRAAVVHIQPHHKEIPVREVLALAASAEQAMNHPLGQAIVRHARAHHAILQPCASWEYVPGVGVVAEIDGQVVRVGSGQLMAEAGIDVAHFSTNGHSQRLAAASQVFVSRSDELLGAIYCSDTLRPESGAVVAQLAAMGMPTGMVSGDSRVVAEHMASSLGMTAERIHAGLLPAQKVEVVQTLQASGHQVAVVGDGVNDVAAMAHADVSLALASASDLARETADVVLVSDDLRDLLVAIEIARHTMNLMEQNKLLVVVPNIAGIAYGALTVMNPMTAMLLNNGTALAATLNGLRPFRRANR